MAGTDQAEAQKLPVSGAGAARRAARAQTYHESIVGKMVSHADMGVGVVIADNGNSLTVAFKNKGIKNVMREFVKFI